MSFRESLKALTEVTKSVDVGGQPFELKKISSGQGLAMGALDEPAAQTLLAIRAGVVLDDDITDEEIMSLPIEWLQDLSDAVMAFNDLRPQEGEEGN